MGPPSAHAARLASRLDGVVALDLEVALADDIAPGLRELRLTGDLGGFAPWPGQDLMVSVPPGGEVPRFRRYTVRRWDPVAGTVDLWVTTTTDGPGAAWAAHAERGDHVDAVGPRGKIALDAEATVHLFVVDESGLAARCAIAEAIAGTADVYSFSLLAVDPEWLAPDAIEPVRARGVTSHTHVLDPGDLDGVRTLLDATTASLERSTIAAYVFGELSMTREVAAALAGLGFDGSKVAVKAYWRGGRANEANGEPDRDARSE